MPEWSSGFPYFLQFQSEFGNKEFMIWDTVSSQSCFCWLYRASPSSAAKNIINLISVLTIWWCPCVELFLVLLEEGVCYDQCVLLAKLLLAFDLRFVLQGQICPLLQVSLDFLLLHFNPLWWKEHLFLMLVLEGLADLHRTVQLQLFQHYCLGHRVGLLWHWMVCLGNKQIIPLFLRLHPSTTFLTLLLTMMATPFLLRDSCPQ